MKHGNRRMEIMLRVPVTKPLRKDDPFLRKEIQRFIDAKSTFGIYRDEMGLYTLWRQELFSEFSNAFQEPGGVVDADPVRGFDCETFWLSGVKIHGVDNP